MKDEILSNIDDPGALERLYRTDKPGFRRAFRDLSPALKDNKLAAFWQERLNFRGDEITWGPASELTFVVIAALAAGIVAKLPALLQIDEEFFYSRNTAFIVFPFLMAYFAWKNKLSAGKIAFLCSAILLGLIFINLLPDNNTSDTLVLSCIHLGLFLWSILGFS